MSKDGRSFEIKRREYQGVRISWTGSRYWENRPYRRAQSTEFAINELRRYAGIQFDAKLVDTFINEVATKI